jgi:hypothetical protein
MKTKLEFGKRSRETTNPQRKPTPMDRLKRIAKWWSRIGKHGRQLQHNTRGAKLSKSRALPQRRP